MMDGTQILPGTGRGTAGEAGGGGGAPHATRPWLTPSTMLRMVPLPASGEDRA